VIVVETGVLLAAANTSDRHHRASSELLAAQAGQLVTPAPVITEAAWLIESIVGPANEARFVTSVANGEFGIEDLDEDDYRRCAELIERYADLGLGLVDASVATIAERRGITTIATLNHRDFHVVRPRHCEAFELLP
jgi:uncharacterized protein